MATENWVTIGGFIATTASAIAAFFAVKQTMLQRIISTKPQIIIYNKEVKTKLTSNNTFSLSFENNDFHYNIPIPIMNVGLGTALNIKYEWLFDYKKAIESCGFNYISNAPMITSMKKLFKDGGKYYCPTEEKDSNFKYYELINNGKFNIYSITKINKELEYIMPVTQEKSPSIILFPSLILLALAESKNSNNTFADSFFFDVMDACKLIIKYEDISGNNITINYNCTLQTTGFKSNSEYGAGLTFKIGFHRIHSRSMPRLERLRKSYANFIDEVDFNKNK
ncbi:hypothetical protein [Enterobacter hormaechei]|uniref:hypothetical protein n=1 Tax=Enterobacter hormaechei TaxID=158836 RepID=UPI000BD0A5D5|nr:hypothetical protein [Enterobacter hormaechei]ELC7204870.1 hypothetical protein [Enterobacter hormaechei]MCU3706943.1 hypothetical protein [Enterobacter hormaechei subsp. steigerwaltii]PCP91801.1 hypothetical protein CP998_23170 [Enterobacter hormaechei]PCQ75256.1 hypothetical protein CQA47_00675 [Enterobacter hormaechei]